MSYLHTTSNFDPTQNKPFYCKFIDEQTTQNETAAEEKKKSPERDDTEKKKSPERDTSVRDEPHGAPARHLTPNSSQYPTTEALEAAKANMLQTIRTNFLMLQRLNNTPVFSTVAAHSPMPFTRSLALQSPRFEAVQAAALQTLQNASLKRQHEAGVRVEGSCQQDSKRAKLESNSASFHDISVGNPHPSMPFATARNTSLAPMRLGNPYPMNPMPFGRATDNVSSNRVPRRNPMLSLTLAALAREFDESADRGDQILKWFGERSRRFHESADRGDQLLMRYKLMMQMAAAQVDKTTKGTAKQSKKGKK